MQIVFTDGLGNEMFQYALYLAMKHHGRQPSINIGIITRNVIHNGFELCDDFEIDRNKLNIVDGGWFGGGLTIFSIRYLGGLLCEKEVGHTYNDKIFKTNKYLIYGYWQNERYFADIADEVRRAFTFCGIDEYNLNIGAEMDACQSVSIHIRRGDYLKHPELMVCSPSYYKRAINYIQEHVDNPIFYVFSDDLEWSEQFMKESGVDYCMVNHNRGKDSYKDMYLMTRCSHNIIANSSFSWWGAWLGNPKDKTVICPEIWFLDYPKRHLALSKWIKIPV